MTDALTTFNLRLQTHVKNAENRFATLNAKIGSGIEQADKELRSQIVSLEEGAAKAKASVEASAAVVTKWVTDSLGSVDGLKSKLDIGMLTARAERADDYAKAASDVAIASVEAAEKAALDAKLAHAEVRAATASKTV